MTSVKQAKKILKLHLEKIESAAKEPSIKLDKKYILQVDGLPLFSDRFKLSSLPHRQLRKFCFTAAKQKVWVLPQ